MKRFPAVIVGFVFLLSGFLKLMDPVGTGFIVAEYFNFFHCSWMLGASKVVGIVLSAAEALIGISLLTGVARKLTAVATFLMVGFFTVVSVLLVVFNPPMDCGCFGQAIHLTHFQTLLKNIVLLVLCLWAFIPLSAVGTPVKRKWVSFSLACVIGLGILIYSLVFIPLEDFTPFRPSHSIGREDAATSWESAKYLYEKDGVRKTFALEELPDSTWTFVWAVDANGNPLSTQAESSVLREDETPLLPLHFPGGESASDLILDGAVFVVSVYDPASLSYSQIARIRDLAYIFLTEGAKNYNDSFSNAEAKFFLLSTSDDPRFHGHLDSKGKNSIADNLSNGFSTNNHIGGGKNSIADSHSNGNNSSSPNNHIGGGKNSIADSHSNGNNSSSPNNHIGGGKNNNESGLTSRFAESHSIDSRNNLGGKNAEDYRLDDIPVLLGDYKTLATFNRSNGGCVYLNDGYIVSKYSRYNYPDHDSVTKILREDPTAHYVRIATRRSVTVQALAVSLLALLFFL